MSRRSLNKFLAALVFFSPPVIPGGFCFPVYFIVDFDAQKEAVKQLGGRMQSTLIAFKDAAEIGRRVGDRSRIAIGALLDKTL